jgi:glutamate-ammonia-ligase adenylyltransferase
MTTAAQDELRSDAIFAAVREAGFGRPRQVCGQIEVMRAKTWGPFRSASSGRDLRLAREIAADAAAAPDPDMAFSAFTRFALAVGDRPGVWDMLADNPHATRLLLQVFGSSGELARDLIADPHVFGRLLSVGSVAIHKSAARLESELSGRLQQATDPEHRMGVIRRFHREETLRIGLHETGGAASIEETLGQLSLLAELTVRTVLTQTYEPLRTRKRSTQLPPLDEIPFAVVAMGKLGGRELGFGSDLDVVFVYEEDRQYRLEHTFYARLAQRLVRALTTLGTDGRLYEVDTRLRPSGNRGALVVSGDAFERYYEKDAALWERQALIRARPFIGTAALLKRITSVRTERAFGGAQDADLSAVDAMRQRLSAAHYAAGTTDIKFGPGGMVDIEFATQAAQMTGSPAQRSDDTEPGEIVDGLRSQSTVQALTALGEQEVAADYLWLSRLLARLRMSSPAGTTIVPEEDAGRRAIARRMGHQGGTAAAAFDEELSAVLDRAHSFYARVFGA